MKIGVLELVWLAAYLVTLIWMLRYGAQRRNRRRQAAAAGVQADILKAVGIYLCGSNDLTRLRALASSHPGEVQQALLRYQSVVGGQREELCALALSLGFVQAWWYDAQSRDVAERRPAFAALAALAHHEPVRRMVREIAEKAFRGHDDQVRVDAARILLAGGEPDAVLLVFEAALSLAPDTRKTIDAELSRHAAVLCLDAIPHALSSKKPLPALQMLNSWQRSLPLADLGPVARHQSPAVRLEAMRLQAYLPATTENEGAVLAGLKDEDPAVRDAAAAAVRVGAPKLDCAENAAASELCLVGAEIAALVHSAAGIAAPVRFSPIGGTITNPFAQWRLVDASE